MKSKNIIVIGIYLQFIVYNKFKYSTTSSHEVKDDSDSGNRITLYRNFFELIKSHIKSIREEINIHYSNKDNKTPTSKSNHMSESTSIPNTAKTSPKKNLLHSFRTSSKYVNSNSNCLKTSFSLNSPSPIKKENKKERKSLAECKVIREEVVDIYKVILKDYEEEYKRSKVKNLNYELSPTPNTDTNTNTNYTDVSIHLANTKHKSPHNYKFQNNSNNLTTIQSNAFIKYCTGHNINKINSLNKNECGQYKDKEKDKNKDNTYLNDIEDNIQNLITDNFSIEPEQMPQKINIETEKSLKSEDAMIINCRICCFRTPDY